MIKDWRNSNHSMSRNERRRAILVPNWEGDIIKYYWGAPAPHLGRHPSNWARMLDLLRHHKNTIDPVWRMDIDSMTLVEDCRSGEARLLIDPWADSWKWGRARTVYHPSVAGMVQMALAAGVIGADDPVAFGNWASGENYEQLGTAADVARPVQLAAPMKLWHGTSSIRLEEIKKSGIINMGRKKGVHMSGSAMRAKYFSTERAQADRKGLTKKQKEDVKPVLLEVTIPPELQPLMRADQDWVKCLHHEQGVKPDDKDWKRSLSEFGQVKLERCLDASFISAVHVL